jgi:hypothetical protein
MNISNELLKTSIWKGITDSNKQINESHIDKKKTARSNRKIVSDINEDVLVKKKVSFHILKNSSIINLLNKN